MTSARSVNPAQDPMLRKQAADWAYRLREEDVSEQEFAAWLDWYEADARHRLAYDDMQAFLAQLDPVMEGMDGLRPDLREDEPGQAPAATPAVAVAPRRSRRRYAWAAAAAVALGVAVMLLSRLDLLEPAAPVQSYAAAEANSEATLADGSHMELASRTQVSVQLTERQRLVTLEQGAAYFTVAHNAARPFLVKVGGFNVRAVGTAFNVRSAGARMVVTVAEGTVEIYSQDRRSSVLARAGTEVTWSADGGSPVVAAVDPAHSLAWKEGRLDYFKEPLESVIADLNRYARVPVRVQGDAARVLAITGTIRTDGVEEWLRALPAMLPVDVSIGEDGAILLSARAG